MKKLIAITLLLLVAMMTSCEEPPKEEVCVKMYLIGGFTRIQTFQVERGADLYVHTSDGSYYLGYNGGLGGFQYLRSGVVDFDIIPCK